ncbi:FAD-dependent oxidoreductase [Cohnella abietis]|nr:FAD-dependent oxidoreductase [Cohnella abietis]
MRRKNYAWVNLIVILCLLMVIPQTQAYAFQSNMNREYVLTSVQTVKSSYDVIVVGTDPEGVIAAVSAARNKLKVLLIDDRPRNILGGLMTLGWLNSLDLNKSPRVSRDFPAHFLNQGLFQEWYNLIGGTSFDVNRAANALNKMVVNEKNIETMLNVKNMEPIMNGNKIEGIRFVSKSGQNQIVHARAIIDATQDADLAAAAGVDYTISREDLGEPDARVAVTLVFRMSGVTDKIWNDLKKRKGANGDDKSIWGYADAREYVSSNPTRVKIRSLNIGRQEDGSLLINTMQIYNIDPLKPASMKEAFDIGNKEAPLIVDFLKKKYKEFSKLEYAGTAPELYVRESRHIKGEYRLTMADLMENRDHWDAIAYGAYEVDVQSMTHQYAGSIVMKPQQYGVPFRSLVPLKVDGLLVVGRSASFDTLPHGSARVIPLGMATAEAAGLAAKLAKDNNMTFRELSKSKEKIAELRKKLTKQGMDLRMVKVDKPLYTKHKDYPGLLTAASIFITVGGYSNTGWKLDEQMNPLRFYYSIQPFYKMFPKQFPKKSVLKIPDLNPHDPITLERAAYIIALSTGIETKPETALQDLLKHSWVSKDTVKGIKDPAKLTNGDSFMIIRDVLKNFAGIEFK